MSTYTFNQPKAGSRRSTRLKRLALTLGVLLLVGLLAVGGIWRFYYENLKPVSNQARSTTVVIKTGSTPQSIANLLHEQGIIRNAWTFERYVQSKNVSGDLQAGTYSLSPSQSVQDIVSQLTHGKVNTELVTILPGQRLDQIRQTLANDGFAEADVDAALDPAQYEGSAALVDKPAGNSLEGYLYPDSFQRTADTDPKIIVEKSIALMQENLTPDIRAAFAKHGLSTYQGIILASIVEQEVSNQADRAQAAQVFLTRLAQGKPLESDVTAKYGSRLAGKGPLLTYDTPYNSYLHAGLPPTPISNVTKSSLQAVANPANTTWMFFVAGDDGTTYFSRTLAEHEALTRQYCTKLCGQ
jgi:UPF0755 protein